VIQELGELHPRSLDPLESIVNNLELLTRRIDRLSSRSGEMIEMELFSESVFCLCF
jgi:hypothetical protein